jgi:hypothetical protein
MIEQYFITVIMLSHYMAQLAMFVEALRSEQTPWGGQFALWRLTQRNNASNQKR